ALATTSRRTCWVSPSTTLVRQLGFCLRQHEQVFELQVVLQLNFLLWEQVGFLFFGNQCPDPLAGLLGGLEVGQSSRRNLAHEEIQQFITSVHGLSLAGDRSLSKPA